MKRTFIFVLLLVSFCLCGFSWIQSIGTSMTETTVGAQNSASCIIVLGEKTINGQVTGTTHAITGDTTLDSTTVIDTDTSDLTSGWAVSGTGIPADTTIASITNSAVLELSNAATATGDDVTLTVSESKSDVITGDTTSGSTTVTDADTFGLTSRWFVSGTGISADTTIASITSSTVFELSQAATATGNDVTLTAVETHGRTITDTTTAEVFVGMKTGNSIKIESVDSSTQLTLASTIAKTATAQDITFKNDFDAVLVTIKIVGESSASTATLSFYATSHTDSNNFSTVPFYTESLTGLAGDTQIITYRFSSYITPKAKITVQNTTAESGTTDDIVVTVVFAGYNG